MSHWNTCTVLYISTEMCWDDCASTHMCNKLICISTRQISSSNYTQVDNPIEMEDVTLMMHSNKQQT